MEELLLIHDEEIKRYRWLYYSPFTTSKSMLEYIEKLLYNVKNNSYFYYDPIKYLYCLNIPHDKGITIIHIIIYEHILESNSNNKNSIFNIISKSNNFNFEYDSRSIIEIKHYKGITDFLKIRSWLEQNLLNDKWIKGK